MSTPELPQLEPVRDDGVRAIQVGLGLWLVAGLVLLVQRDQLADRGTQWWLAVCGAGLLSGAVHLAIFSRRRVLDRDRDVLDDAVTRESQPTGSDSSGPDGSGPDTAGPTGAGPTG